MSDISMPNDIVAWTTSNGWGTHHLRWHVERIWDRLSPGAIAWAEQQGWGRYPIQEGEETNGLAFLAMHRVMIGMLTTQFPAHAELFAGWDKFPTDPNDPDDPVPPDVPPGLGGLFRPAMLLAIRRIESTPEEFDGDDAFGCFLETRARPFPNDPDRRSPDDTTGIHNYVHGRFARPETGLDMGNPEVNINNQRFWRLHGWIDRMWTAYRTATGRSEDDPRYKEALEEARHHMMHTMSMALQPGAAPARAPPEVMRSVSHTLFGS